MTNILDARLNRPGTSGQAYQETYGDSYETDGPDPDTGVQVDIRILAACNIHEGIRMTKRLVNVSIFLTCSIFFASCCVAQRIAAASESQDENTNRKKHYVIELTDKDRRSKEGEIREFIWSHWRAHRHGSVLVTSYSKEGLQSNSEYVLENDEQQVWCMKVTVGRPDLKDTTNEQTQYRVYGVERIKPPVPEHPSVIPIPEDLNLGGNAYRLVFKDREGKNTSRGSL
jgi:hypothetical protein